MNGSVNATSFSGDGSGLTNVGGTGGPSSAIEVYDANDQFLGYSSSFPTGDSGKFTYNGFGSPPTWTYPNNSAPPIRIPSLDKEVVFELGSGNPASGIAYYLSTDCSGTPYGAPIASYQIIAFLPPNPPYTLHLYTGQGAPQLVIIQSYALFGMGCNSSGVLTNPIQSYFVPLTDVTLPFVTPVALPLKFKVGGTN